MPVNDEAVFWANIVRLREESRLRQAAYRLASTQQNAS